MTNPILPIIVVGPAIVTWNGHSYYFKSGVKLDYKRETFTIETDFDGQIDERMKAQMTTISGTPVGMYGASGMTQFFPYPVSQIGTSIFGAQSTPTTPRPLVIVTKFGGTSNAGQTITYPRGAMTKLPTLRLKPTDTLLGDLEFTMLGVPTVQPNTANAWATLASATFADTTFDENQIITDIYGAAWGASPYTSMGSMNGFEINIAMKTNTIPAVDFGNVDMILESLVASVSFAPSNLTEAQVNALFNWDGTGYIQPGMSIAPVTIASASNLVITGSGNGAKTLTATIFNAGPKDGGYVYDSKAHRFTATNWVTRRTWTSGVANPLFTFVWA